MGEFSFNWNVYFLVIFESSKKYKLLNVSVEWWCEVYKCHLYSDFSDTLLTSEQRKINFTYIHNGCHNHKIINAAFYMFTSISYNVLSAYRRVIVASDRGGPRIFVHGGGGGGAKDYVRARASWARSPKFLTAGVQGPGSSRAGSVMLSRAIWALWFFVLHSDTKWD